MTHIVVHRRSSPTPLTITSEQSRDETLERLRQALDGANRIKGDYIYIVDRLRTDQPATIIMLDDLSAIEVIPVEFAATP